MTTTSQISSSRIARRAEQGARPAIPTQVAVDKLANECKCKNQIKYIYIHILHIYIYIYITYIYIYIYIYY